MRINAYFILLISFSFLFASCGKRDASLSGAGATFPAPFYNVMFKTYYEHTGVKASYGAIGSGGGVRSLTDRTVDFGATDVFMSEKEMQKLGAEIVHLPTCIGGVVLSYNIAGIDTLRLTAALVSEIYRGEITRWDDEKLTALNSNVQLPSKPIIPVFRSDGSGTTAVFSEYMSKVDTAWYHTIGEGKSLKFPKGLAAKGNPGVAGVVAETDGAIGYIGSEFAFALNMPMAMLQNSSGRFVYPTNRAISLSANIDMPDDTRASITNSPDSGAYPIATFTWLVAYKDQTYNKRSAQRVAHLANLFNYVLTDDAQCIAAKTHYSPLPPVVVEKARAIVASMTYNGRSVIDINTTPLHETSKHVDVDYR